MASPSAPSVNEPPKDLIVVHTVQLKPMIKSGRMVCSGISDVVITSVYSEKTRLKKLMMMRIMNIIIIIIMNKMQETNFFSGFSRN